MKARGIKTWKEVITGVQQLVRLLFNNSFMSPGLVLKDTFDVMKTNPKGKKCQVWRYQNFDDINDYRGKFFIVCSGVEKRLV